MGRGHGAWTPVVCTELNMQTGASPHGGLALEMSTSLSLGGVPQINTEAMKLFVDVYGHRSDRLWSCWACRQFSSPHTPPYYFVVEMLTVTVRSDDARYLLKIQLTA